MTDGVLKHLPRIDIVAMGRATRVPDWYGDAVGDTFDVRSFVIHHPDGPIVIDAGIGSGSELINKLYAPQIVDIGDALASCGVDLSQVHHLHFDHCEARRFTAPTFERAELEAARAPHYTVPDWIPDGDVQLVDGDAEIAVGVQVLATGAHARPPVGCRRSHGRPCRTGLHRAQDFAASNRPTTTADRSHGRRSAGWRLSGDTLFQPRPPDAADRVTATGAPVRSGTDGGRDSA